MKKLLLPAVLALFTFASCKKDKADDAKPITKENVIGSFKVTSLTYTMNGVTADGMQTLQDCEKDDLYIFKAENVFNYSDAGTTCSSPGDYSDTGTLSGDSIMLSGRALKITSLTPTAMNVTETTSGSGTSIVTNATFTRQ